ncbi:class I adenylate-forming enzyme family protein [Bacillus sp. Marseille-P3661]|uniref:class I adenylate-forming enzyme family protein n=1 Tax=Bacillus sp. Marseille-P3661 TaxID=1936234 RepID=UPI0015E17A6C|nr:class I adenylate-forming enzyme family protein [Bacillus sp. Marseille-P3661]
MKKQLIGSIGSMVKKQARIYGDKPLFIKDDVIRTYQDFDFRTDRLASGLIHLGITTGKPIATYLKNSIELLEAYTAIGKAKAATVCVNSALTPREITYIFQDSEAEIIITDDEHLNNVEQVLADCPCVKHVIVVGESGDHLAFEDVLTMSLYTELPDVTGDDLFSIVYTSGTTGQPKGTRLTHRNWTWVTAACVDALNFEEDDIFVSSLPLFHSYAVNTCFLQVIYTGATEVLIERFSPTAVLNAIQKYKGTVFPGVPTMFNYLTNFAERKQYDTSTLRMAISAGAVLTEKVISDFEKEFNIKIYNGWGSTETATFATFERVGDEQLPGSCGLPLPGCTIRIVDENGEDCAPGVRGEMIIRGPNVMMGYQKKPIETNKALKNNWYHTGDVAYIDENGYIFVIDRLKDIIISGGYNVAPKEVEDAIIEHPAVLDAAVVGLPDEALGQVIKAFVVLKEGQFITSQELLDSCRLSLGKYKLPRFIEFVESLPRTTSGKIQRFALVEKQKV